MELIIVIAAIIAGIIQGITGFGAGIVLMMFLPFYYTVTHSAGLTGAIATFLCSLMVYTYRKNINYKKIFLPALFYILIASITINFTQYINQELMKRVFGIFLTVLSLYYLFLQKENGKKTMPLVKALLFIGISAVCDALFGIGGPLMVLYYLIQTENPKEFMGTLQFFFLINGIYNTIFRVYKGIILLPTDLIIILCGALGVFIGVIIANRLAGKINPEMAKKMTYLMIGFSGVINLF